MGARFEGLCLWWCGVVDVVLRLLGLWEHLLGHMLPSSVLVLILLCGVEVVGVLSFRCGGLEGHFGPLRVVFVLVVSVLPEFLVTTNVVALSLLRESEVL